MNNQYPSQGTEQAAPLGQRGASSRAAGRSLTSALTIGLPRVGAAHSVEQVAGYSL